MIHTITCGGSSILPRHEERTGCQTRLPPEGEQHQGPFSDLLCDGAPDKDSSVQGIERRIPDI